MFVRLLPPCSLRNVQEEVPRPKSWFTHAEERKIMVVEENEALARRILKWEMAGKIDSQITQYWSMTKETKRTVDLQREIQKESDALKRRELEKQLRH